MKHTLFAIAAVLLFSSLALSLAGWAAKQPMKKLLQRRGRGRMTDAAIAGLRTDRADPADDPALDARRSAAGSSSTWSLLDRSRARVRVVPRSALLRDHRRDRDLPGRSRGSATCAPYLLWTNPEGRFRHPGGQTGGFLDPNCSGLDHRLRDRDRDRRSRSASGVAVWLSRVRPADGCWRAIVESTIEMLAGMLRRSRWHCSACCMFEIAGARRSCQTTSHGGMVYGYSFLIAAGAILSLRRAPISSSPSVREGLQAIPNHVREASYARRQDEDRDDSAGAASGRRGRR